MVFYLFQSMDIRQAEKNGETGSEAPGRLEFKFVAVSGSGKVVKTIGLQPRQ